MSFLIVPLLYPDLAGLLNFSHSFQHNFRVEPQFGDPASIWEKMMLFLQLTNFQMEDIHD